MDECERCGCELLSDAAIYTLRGYDFCRDCYEANARDEAEMQEAAADDRAHAAMERRMGL